MHEMEPLPPRKPTPPLGPQYFVQHRAYSTAEIIRAYCILTGVGFPPELAGRILDYAEFWAKEGFGRHDRMGLTWCGGAEVSTLYLQTSPIGKNPAFDGFTLVRPRRVVVRTNASNYGPHPIGDAGQYRVSEGSAFEISWFDATIFREDMSWTGAERTEPTAVLFNKTLAPADSILRETSEHVGQDLYFYEICHPRGPEHKSRANDDVDSLPSWMFSDLGDKLKLRGGYTIVPNGAKQRWLVQRNVFGYGRKEHIIDWTTEDVEDEAWPLDGTGKGKGFVASLRRGDRIAIWARTIEADNDVESVVVDVYHSIF